MQQAGQDSEASFTPAPGISKGLPHGSSGQNPSTLGRRLERFSFQTMNKVTEVQYMTLPLPHNGAGKTVGRSGEGTVTGNFRAPEGPQKKTM